MGEPTIVPGIGETITSFERKPPTAAPSTEASSAEAEQTSTVKDDSAAKKKSSGESNDDDIEKKYAGTSPVPFLSLFRHGTPKDKLIISVGMLVQIGVGLSWAGMNLVFGEVLDDLSSTTGSLLDSTKNTIRIMAILAGAFGAAAFVGMSAIPYGAARITNRIRMAYVSSVLSQDMAFFDEKKPGEVVAALAEYTMDLEEGMSIKLGEGIQATAGGLGGLAVALYFSWQITVSAGRLQYLGLSNG